MFSKSDMLLNNIGLIFLTSTLLFWTGCDSDKSSTGSGSGGLQVNSLVSTGCKPDGTGPGESLNCFHYQYNSNNVLEVDHTNAVFNCCADSFAVTVQGMFNTIVIEELEFTADGAIPACKCICPTDLSFEVSDLLPRKYTVRIITPYGSSYGPIDTLEFEIDLRNLPSGDYCVPGL